MIRVLLTLGGCAPEEDTASPAVDAPPGWEVMEVECPSGESLTVDVPVIVTPPQPLNFQAWYHYKQSYVDQAGIEGGWLFATTTAVFPDGSIRVECTCNSSPTVCRYDRIVVFYQQPE